MKEIKINKYFNEVIKIKKSSEEYPEEKRVPRRSLDWLHQVSNQWHFFHPRISFSFLRLRKCIGFNKKSRKGMVGKKENRKRREKNHLDKIG